MPGGNPHHQGNPTRPPISACEKDFLAGGGKRPGTSGGQPVRLYVRGIVTGHKRGLRNQYEHTSLIRLEGVSDKAETGFYVGKKVAFIYKAEKKKGSEKTKFRCIWGKILRAHGTNGVVRAKFRSNLPSSATSARVRIMLYPSRV